MNGKCYLAVTVIFSYSRESAKSLTRLREFKKLVILSLRFSAYFSIAPDWHLTCAIVLLFWVHVKAGCKCKGEECRWGRTLP
jgi:hypothetical protein